MAVIQDSGLLFFLLWTTKSRGEKHCLLKSIASANLNFTAFGLKIIRMIICKAQILKSLKYFTKNIMGGERVG